MTLTRNFLLHRNRCCKLGCMNCPYPKNPILAQAFDVDWYYPPDLPPEILKHPLYEKAYNEGWHEWIETEMDFTAVKNGFVYDLSRDYDGNPAYWFEGQWQLHDGTTVPVEDEEEVLQYVGRGDQVMRFCETFLRFTKTGRPEFPLAPIQGNPYRFLPWMRKIVAPLFGWINPSTPSRVRRYRTLLLEVAKKNAKSSLISALSNYMLIADGTPKAQVYVCACDRNQARIIFDESANYVKESPQLAEMAEVVDSRSRIVYHEAASFLQVLSADAHRNDGIDSSFTAIDEIHRHPNRKLFDVMERAGKARPQPLMAVITTYGPSTTDGSIWAELHNEGKAQFAGERPNSWRFMYVCASAEPIVVTAKADVAAGDTVIPVLRVEQPIDVGPIDFDLSHVEDHGSKITVEITEPVKRFQTFLKVRPVDYDIPRFSEAMANVEWATIHGVKRANPSADAIFPAQETLDAALSIRSPVHEAETKQLEFNIVSGSGHRAISAAIWKANGEFLVQPKKLIGKSAYAAMDWAFSNDLVALSIVVPKWDVSTPFMKVPKEEQIIELLSFAWLADHRIELREEEEKFPYRHHAKEPYLFDDKGCIRFCEGRVVDFGQIVDEAYEILTQFQIVSLAYDENYAQFGINALSDRGVTCVPHKQSKPYMGPSTKQFLAMVNAINVHHGNNPILDRAVEGAVLSKKDDKGNQQFSKEHSKNRIDPLVGHVMATGFATNPPIQPSGAWADSESGTWG